MTEPTTRTVARYRVGAVEPMAAPFQTIEALQLIPRFGPGRDSLRVLPGHGLVEGDEVVIAVLAHEPGTDGGRGRVA